MQTSLISISQICATYGSNVFNTAKSSRATISLGDPPYVLRPLLLLALHPPYGSPTANSYRLPSTLRFAPTICHLHHQCICRFGSLWWSSLLFNKAVDVAQPFRNVYRLTTLWLLREHFKLERTYFQTFILLILIKSSSSSNLASSAHQGGVSVGWIIGC